MLIPERLRGAVTAMRTRLLRLVGRPVPPTRRAVSPDPHGPEQRRASGAPPD